MSVYLKEFAEYLRKLRNMHNYTQEYLGNILDMSYSSYGKYEVGASKLHLEQAVKLSLRYGITIDPSDLTHYKLVQVILMHESNSPELKRIIELNAKADKVEKLQLAEKSA